MLYISPQINELRCDEFSVYVWWSLRKETNHNILETVHVFILCLCFTVVYQSDRYNLRWILRTCRVSICISFFSKLESPSSRDQLSSLLLLAVQLIGYIQYKITFMKVEHFQNLYGHKYILHSIYCQVNILIDWLIG